jgi:hypothetical protein
MKNLYNYSWTPVDIAVPTFEILQSENADLKSRLTLLEVRLGLVLSPACLLNTFMLCKIIQKCYSYITLRNTSYC